MACTLVVRLSAVIIANQFEKVITTIAHTAFDSDRVEGKLGSVEPSSGG